MGHRAPLLWLALPFLGGLAVGRMGAAVPLAMGLAVSMAASAAALLATWLAPRLWGPALTGSMLLAGNAAYGIATCIPLDWNDMPEREARLILRLDRVNPGAETTRKVTGTATIVRAAGRLDELVGQRIYFSAHLRRTEAPPVASSVISAAGLLGRVPLAPPPDSFEGYLSGLGVNFRLARARFGGQQVPPSAYRLFCERLAARMNGLLGEGIERKPAIVAVYRAMMLGRRRGLSEEQDQLFLRGGSMHLFAINGLHIGVVALSMNALLGLIRSPRPLSAALVMVVLWLDVDSTGASPSAVRAFLMVAVMESAWALRLPGNPLAALAASALVVSLVQPMDLFSASFQMSYAVVAGIITLGIPLGVRLRDRLMEKCNLGPVGAWRLRDRARSSLARHAMPALGVGAAAAIVGAASGVEFFGLFSPVGIAVNLLLAPLASLVIVAGFSSIVAGLAGGIFATRLLNSAAGVLLVSIDGILRLATAAPWAWFPAHYRAGWIGPVALVLVVSSCLFGYGTRWRADRGGYWPPFAIAALILILGVRFGLP
jgi:competence protein ComEC